MDGEGERKKETAPEVMGVNYLEGSSSDAEVHTLTMLQEVSFFP